MKRMIPIIALLLAPIMLLTACAMPSAVTKKTSNAIAPANANNYNAEPEGVGEDVQTGRVWPWENPTIQLPAYTGSVTVPGSVKSLKVLAIGDASSKDAMEFLYKIAKEAGIPTIKIAVLYRNKGGFLNDQWNDFNANRANYTYYEDTGNGWVATENAKPKDMLCSDSWDYVILHQNVAKSGDVNAIDNNATKSLSNILSPINYLLRTDASNPNKNAKAKIMWMQVWAYENNSRNNLFNSFKDYDKDQMKMYNQGVEGIKTHVITQRYINGVLPVGTAIQNMREAYWRDGLTKDAEFLTNTGKVAAAVSLFKSLTGYDINDLELSDPVFDHARPHLGVIKESANNAHLNPYEVTPSVYKMEW